MSAPAPTAGSWVIDNRSTYDGQHGLGCKPLQLGAVVAECPTAFGSITIRDTSTIGQPCPPKDELDALGLQHANLIAAAPELLEAARLVDRMERLYDYRPQLCARAGDFANSAESRLKAKHDLEDVNLELREIRSDIAAAIAKAEGRA